LRVLSVFSSAASSLLGLNPRIALLFLRTRIALGVKKSPTRLIRKTNAFFSSDKPGVIDCGELKAILHE